MDLFFPVLSTFIEMHLSNPSWTRGLHFHHQKHALIVLAWSAIRAGVPDDTAQRIRFFVIFSSNPRRSEHLTEN